MSRLEHLRRRLGARLAQGFFEGASRLGRLHPQARPEAHGVEVTRDISYDPAHPVRRLENTFPIIWSICRAPAGSFP